MTPTLGEQTWSDLAGRAPLVILPLGSCEQHGPHLPVETDTAIAASVAREAARELARDVDVLLAPAQPYAASGEHEGFPGTVSIGHEALRVLLLELGRSLFRWAGRLLVVNGHGGNAPTLADAVARLRAEGRDAAWWACTTDSGDAHAGRSETALMLALDPRTVRTERAEPGRTEPIAELMPALRASAVRRVSPNGVLGNPAGASAAEGERMLETMAAAVRASARAWRVLPDGRLEAGHMEAAV
ncbi:mycofactocin biosynthesis peptidyl-dipeptidase MftE [Allosalinactinospora lopnorensis]|uniref:mycofactocin biosynthesis peptidyl-dipeptidase MftE n=1 Tax=Allosalinactinospora lopnorensis TaxID=1352348 RepID=UPI000623E695|nr:mycofactocin biosynthesis peptidyl-dipeptidase MftE [Allosalinactinospora lopnorensis]